MSSIVDFYKSFFYDPVKEMVSSPSGHVPGVDSFLDSFVNNYTKNKEFFGCFLTSIFKAYVAEVDWVPNPQYRTYVLNFFLVLSASGEKRAFEFASGNFCGAPLRQMKKMQQRDAHPRSSDSLVMK